MIAAALVVCGIVYQLLVIVAALRFRGGASVPAFTPPVSLLKPVSGRDENFYAALQSHAEQAYPTFEILFGLRDERDPTFEDISRLRREYPELAMRVVMVPENDAPNRKVGVLEALAREATHDVLLVNDADIVVRPDYLERVIGLLADEATGLVTCLYRGHGYSLPAKAEALGVATEFRPSVLVARLLSSQGFALGSTMAFRRRELEAIGGFQSIRDYLADDYQLGARIAALGKRVAVSDSVVETSLGAGSWSDVWKHQVRWSRTIRISRPAGYYGYVVTQTTFWCLASAAFGHYAIALTGLAIRLIAAAMTIDSIVQLPLVPLRDLFGFAVWCAGVSGNSVEWRGLRYRLLRDGRMEEME